MRAIETTEQCFVSQHTKINILLKQDMLEKEGHGHQIVGEYFIEEQTRSCYSFHRICKKENKMNYQNNTGGPRGAFLFFLLVTKNATRSHLLFLKQNRQNPLPFFFSCQPSPLKEKTSRNSPPKQRKTSAFFTLRPDLRIQPFSSFFNSLMAPRIKKIPAAFFIPSF